MSGPGHDLRVDLESPRKEHDREVIFTGDNAYLVIDGYQVFGVTSLEIERVDAQSFGRLHIGYVDHADGDIKDSDVPHGLEVTSKWADEIVPNIAYSSKRLVRKVTISIEMVPENEVEASG